MTANRVIKLNWKARARFRELGLLEACSGAKEIRPKRLEQARLEQPTPQHRLGWVRLGTDFSASKAAEPQTRPTLVGVVPAGLQRREIIALTGAETEVHWRDLLFRLRIACSNLAAIACLWRRVITLSGLDRIVITGYSPWVTLIPGRSPGRALQTSSEQGGWSMAFSTLSGVPASSLSMGSCMQIYLLRCRIEGFRGADINWRLPEDIFDRETQDLELANYWSLTPHSCEVAMTKLTCR